MLRSIVVIVVSIHHVAHQAESKAPLLCALRWLRANAQLVLLLFCELEDLAHRLHHCFLCLRIMLLLHKVDEVLGDHAAVDEVLALLLLFLCLFEKLHRLIPYGLVL